MVEHEDVNDENVCETIWLGILRVAKDSRREFKENRQWDENVILELTNARTMKILKDI